MTGLLLLAVVSVVPTVSAAPEFDRSQELITQLENLAPLQLTDYESERISQLESIARNLNAESARLCKQCAVVAPQQIFNGARHMSNLRQRTDTLLHRMLEHRLLFADQPKDEKLLEHVRQYLTAMTALVDLCGRMNEHYAGILRDASFMADRFRDGYIQLAELLRADESGIGVAVLAWSLTEPAEPLPAPQQEVLDSFRRVLLVQMYQKGRPEVIPVLAELLRSQAHPQWRLVAAEAIMRIGLPQDPLPTADEADRPSITAGELVDTLTTLRPLLPTALQARFQTVYQWAKARSQAGLSEPELVFGGVSIQPGDWILLRNSSPYNSCTSLAPGLFTHVGVAALHQGEDGKRRLVVVDVTERKRWIDGDNVDKDLASAIHYCVLRHEDPQVGKRMGEVAATLIGNEMEFDLTFDTAKVAALRGQDLRGKKIVTYCAGLLLLCAQETGLPREEFFPIPETPLPGNGRANFESLGLSFGDDLLSPTGSLFARRMKVIAFSKPMFDPVREVQQRVFDHFPKAMQEKILKPRANLYQQLRLELAEFARSRSTLKQLIAAAANINPDTDLVAAAKAAIVVETIDEVAFGAGEAYERAMQALTAGPLETLQDLPPDQIQQITQLREQHSDLWQQLQSGTRFPRDIIDDLIDFYAEQGCREMDRRFFDHSQ